MFFAIITIEITGRKYGWQGEWVAAHRGVTRQDAYWEVMGKAISAAGLLASGQTITTTYFSLEPQRLPT